jgi:hypothetical protein
LAGTDRGCGVKINLRIERMVLDGLPVERREIAAIQAAIEAELGRLLLARCIVADSISSAAAPRINTGGFEYADGIAPAHLGRQIAQSVYQGVDDNFIM